MPEEESDLETVFGIIDMGIEKIKEIGVPQEKSDDESVTYPMTCSYCGSDVLPNEGKKRRAILLLCLCGKSIRCCLNCLKTRRGLQKVLLHLSSCEQLS